MSAQRWFNPLRHDFVLYCQKRCFVCFYLRVLWYQMLVTLALVLCVAAYERIVR